MTTTIDELDVRMTALEAGHDSRLDAIAAIGSDTRGKVEKIERSMVIMLDLEPIKAQVNSIAAVSQDTRGVLKRLEDKGAEHDRRFDRIEADVSVLKGDVGELKTGMARVLEILEARV